LIDLDAWERDRLDEAKMRGFIDALVEAGPSKLAQTVDAMDPELVALYLQRQLRVYDLTVEEPVPDEAAGHYYPTPDRFFLLDILPAGEEGKSLERMIDYLYRADLEMARRVVMSARWELASDLEEHSYRWRAGRMADLGYADFYEALAIYKYLDPATVRLDDTQPNVAAQASPASLPVQLAAVLDTQSGFARALATLPDEAEIERLQGLLLVLVNRAMAADRVEPADLEGAKRTLTRAVGYLGLGLAYLSREDPARAAEALRSVALERIFRVGFSLMYKLRALAEALSLKGFVQLEGASTLLLDPPYSDLFERLRRLRPDPFSSLAEIRDAATALEEAAKIGPAVLALAGGREAVDRAVDAAVNPREEIRFGTLVRTAAANALFGRALSVAPLHPRELRQVAGKLSGAELPPELRAQIATALGALPPHLIDPWLVDFGARLVEPGGVLVRYSWLK
ncbi:MAG: DUF6178 family protein, partial [Polyangia bacterium]